MSPSDPSPSQPPAELLDLLRQTFRALVAEPDGGDGAQAAAARLAEGAARHGIRSAAELLPLIHRAWAELPPSATVPREQREALLHRLTSALIATHYESR